MNSALALALRFTADTAQALRGVTGLGRAVGRVGDDRQRSGVQAERAVQREMARTGSTLDRVRATAQAAGQAREVLGVRAERSIQREIAQTQAAYNRLARSGQLNARELQRAHQAAREQIRELNREMNGAGRWERAGQLGRGVGAVVAGVGAGGYIVMQPALRTMSYDRRLAMVANTAYSDQGKDGRQAGVKEIASAVDAALRAGGGTREDALETYNNLVGSGALGNSAEGRKAAAEMLPTIQRYATGTGSDPNELGRIMARGHQSFNLMDSPYALDMALRGGDLGGFELRDQSKWLPDEMASANSKLGMSGEKDFAYLVALNQAASVTAGTTDKAGNNVVGLLNKINSVDVANNAKKFGINMADELSAGRAKGQNAVEVMIEIADRIASRDKRYRAIQQQLAETTDQDQRRQLLAAQEKILQGTAVGQLVPDQEASNALFAAMGQRHLIKENVDQILKARGAGEVNFKTIEATPSYQLERDAIRKTIAEREATEGLTKAIGGAARLMADYADKYPGLTAAIVGATTALGGLAAVIAGIGVSGLLANRVGGLAPALSGAGLGLTAGSNGLARPSAARVPLAVAPAVGGYGSLFALPFLLGGDTTGPTRPESVWRPEMVAAQLEQAQRGKILRGAEGDWFRRYADVSSPAEQAAEIKRLTTQLEGLTGRDGRLYAEMHASAAQKIDVGGELVIKMDPSTRALTGSFTPNDPSVYRGRHARGMGGN